LVIIKAKQKRVSTEAIKALVGNKSFRCLECKATLVYLKNDDGEIYHCRNCGFNYNPRDVVKKIQEYEKQYNTRLVALNDPSQNQVLVSRIKPKAAISDAWPEMARGLKIRDITRIEDKRRKTIGPGPILINQNETI